MVSCTVGHIQPKEPIGLKDGGHVILSCSNCAAQLVDIWIQMPDSGQHWKGRATCPYCGDKSYIQEWDGGYAIGGISIPNPKDSDNPIEKTRIVDVGTEGDDVILFRVVAINKTPVNGSEKFVV